MEFSRTSSINEEIKSRSKDKTFSEVGTAKANQMQDSGFIPAAKLMRGAGEHGGASRDKIPVSGSKKMPTTLATHEPQSIH